MKKPLVSTKSFLLRNYVIFLAFSILVTATLASLFTFVQLRALNAVYLSRIEKVIESNRNEFLNEMALEDFDSLQHHLEILKADLNVDTIELKFQGLNFSTPPTQIPSESSWMTLLLTVVDGASPLKIDLASEFQSLQAQLTVYYRAAFSDAIADPVARAATGLFIISLLPFGLIFIFMFNKISHGLIQPLTTLTSELSHRNRRPTYRNRNNIVLQEIYDLEKASDQFRQVESEALLSDIARQISHDIRSPLSALKIVASRTQDLPENVRSLLQSAASRIQEISEELLHKGQSQSGTPGSIPKTDLPSQDAPPHLLATTIDSVLNEKRVQLSSENQIYLEFDPELEHLHATSHLDPSILKRILSNLINNSVDAVNEEGGLIRVTLRIQERWIEIQVIDNGKGIPEAIRKSLGRKGLTFGKKGGTGLGLYHAKKYLENAGGSLEVQSRESLGTTITLQLPKAPPPAWFPKYIGIPQQAQIWILDDDESIHQIWKLRLSHLGHHTHLSHYRSARQLEQSLLREEATPKPNTLFLCDYYLKGEGMNGIDLIEKYQLEKQSILVTSLHEDPSIQNRCLERGIELLPKELAGIVRIQSPA